MQDQPPEQYVALTGSGEEKQVNKAAKKGGENQVREQTWGQELPTVRLVPEEWRHWLEGTKPAVPGAN